jgi:potassium/hydrogen antiporter
MAEPVLMAFIVVSIIIFFGFMSELIFSKTGIPDVLLLIVLGIIMGPYCLKIVDVGSLQAGAPYVTSFVLLFLLFDGAFNIDLVSLAAGIGKSLQLTFMNFFVSVGLVTLGGIAYGIPFLHSLLLGTILGGISSAFVIPVVSRLRMKRDNEVALTIESALTDVLCIVLALAVMEIIVLEKFSIKSVLSQIFALFGVATFIGILGGIVWIILITRVFVDRHSYMIMIAYLLMLFVFAEFLGGNGAIAGLVFGIVIQNSRSLMALFDKKGKGTSVTTPIEKLFYGQLTFFLKTIFFVYVGILLDLSSWVVIAVGLGFTLLLFAGRQFSNFLIKDEPDQDRRLMKLIFARGLAAAAIAQFTIQHGLPGADQIVRITIAVIVLTIMLSSLGVFLAIRRSMA